MLYKIYTSVYNMIYHISTSLRIFNLEYNSENITSLERSQKLTSAKKPNPVILTEIH